MPQFVVEDSAAIESVSTGSVGALEAFGCSLEDTSGIILKNIKPFSTTSEFIAYASPDSTYAVTKRLMDDAKKSVLIGIYDFSASYMKTLVRNAMIRGVKLSLMLDVNSKGEQQLMKDLDLFGAQTVPAPSCSSKFIHFFSNSHEKVIVIDDTWVLVQSGNYSENSIPLNEKDGADPANFRTGNRDMGVAIKSKPLAEFFTRVLRGDMKLELDAEGAEALVSARIKNLPMLVEAAPKKIPVKLFKSKSFNPPDKISVLPVLSPDNYMKVVPDFLRSATKSIYIEQQYIRSTQKAIGELLSAMREAMDAHPNMDVRIILGKLFGPDDIKKEKANLANLKSEFGLKLGTNVRYIDTDRLVHCHNKLIVVDNRSVLVSSQNWSDTAVLQNREAGLMFEYPEIAKYYAGIFEADWSTAKKTLPAGAPETVSESRVAKGNFIEVVPADYMEV